MIELGACVLALLGAGQEEWSWQKPHAQVDPKGDLVWKPEPFVFRKGASVRYIDFEGGSDENAGDAPERSWKHHPWDPAAAGKAAACTGIHTYVFKRGVVYRGNLVVKESGRPGDPIRLTSDPAWGKGEAVICGSERVTNWRKGADHKDIPEPQKVWWADLPFAPRCLWRLERDGRAVRIPLARTPNWKVSDPDDVKSEWWHWDYKGEKPFDVFIDRGGRRYHLGIDTEHLTRPADYYQDAILWTEHGWVMGAPYPVRVEVVETSRKGLGFGGRWGGAGSYKIVRFNRYFLEDKPHYLDDPEGEFWFEKKGPGGRLYLRLPGDADPNAVPLEAACRSTLIDAARMSHLHITGLTFRFTNVYWKLDGVPYADGDALDTACIRLLGPGEDLLVSHCLFEHVNTPVFLKAAGGPEVVIDGVVVSDNDVAFTDRGGFQILEGSAWGEVIPKSGLLHDVKVLRNRLRQIGMRPTRFNLGFAIDILNARTVEVAGNVLDRCYSGGINVSGAKRNSSARDVPLSRILIHHNKVTDPLLSNDDFGGIETWQGGPAYVYNNISGNPGGYRHFGMLDPKKPAWARFGHAYYLDGAFKNYHFNNIAWGKSKDPLSRLGNASAFQEIISYQNTFFNNTIYNFVKGTRRQAPHAGRDKFLGNVWQGIGEWTFWHAQPARTPAEGNAADAGPPKAHYALETNAYSRNVFYDVAPTFGVFEPSGRWHESFESFQKALADRKAMAADVGVMAPAPPLRDPARFDFRPSPGSAAVDRGVKVFVPWGLYAEVAEWNFYPAGDGPGRILDEHWTMTPYHLERDDYYTRPTAPLRTVNVRAEDFVEGPLEDWIRGALRLNGRDQYAVVPQAELAGPFRYEISAEGGRRAKETRTASGPQLKNPQIHATNFLLEVYFRTEPGHTGGVLIEKMSGTGYSLAVDERGGVAFAVKGEGGGGRVASRGRVNDGKWHHVVAEADRGTATLTLYVDGKKDASGAGVGPGVTLANEGDLHVGGTPSGRCLAGMLDFLRVAWGTLADARTTIEELTAWEFDGPHLRDFAGRRPAGARRDAGALELTD